MNRFRKGIKMRGKNLWLLGLMISMIVLLCSSVSAQDFGQLLQAVEKMEANLKDLIEEESQNRKQAILALQKNIDQISASGQSGNFTDSDIESIMAHIIELKSENVKLRILVEKYNQGLASIHPGRGPGDQSKVDDLHAELANLGHKVDKLKTGGSHAKPKTSVNGKVFSHGLMDMSDKDGSYSEFALSRAYVTLRSSIAADASLRITSDFKTYDGKYDIILKYAYFDWKPSFAEGYWTMRVGLQPTLYIDYMNKLWGRRYLEKTISDKKKFLTSSDLGLGTIVGFGPKSEYGFVNLAILNGTSYTGVTEENSAKDINLVALVKPFKNVPILSKSVFMSQFYAGTQNESLDDISTIDSSGSSWDTTVTTVSSSDWKRQIVSVGGLFAFKKTFDLGFDLNFTTVGKGYDHDAVNKRGLSFFGSFYLYDIAHNAPFWKSINFFGRIDSYNPNTDVSGNGQNSFYVGVETVPYKGLHFSLNFRATSYEDENVKSDKVFGLNTQFKF